MNLMMSKANLTNMRCKTSAWILSVQALVECGGNTSMASRVSAQVKKANCMRCVSISEVY